MANVWDRSGGDPRGRSQNQQGYYQGQSESQSGPLADWTAQNAGYWGQQAQQGYNPMMQAYAQAGGIPYPGGQQPQYGGGQGGPSQGMQQPQQSGGMTPDQAYQQASSTLDINLPKDQMEAGLTNIYKNVPGFEQAYKESVKINGQWYDLGQGYGGAGAKWQTPRINAGGESSGSAGGGFVGGAGAAGFPSYGGYQDFAKTGGFSPEDIANMRARGAGGVRSAYAGAQREVGRQRALQGGYSPNATATLAKMAREGGQMTSDAMQNVEAGIAGQRQQGRLAGLGGMFGVESLQNQNQQQNKWNALQGMGSLYGSSQNMANQFGNQALQSSSQRDQFGQNQQRAGIEGQKQPGAYDVAKGKVNDVMDWVNTGIGVANQFRNERRKTPEKPLTSRPLGGATTPNKAPVYQNRP